MRVLSLLVASFLFLSTIETWAGYWLAGRWFVSSRYASVSLQTVRNWLDRGIITRTTQQAKIFIQHHGKWIVLTLGLSQIIREVENIQSTQYCYLPSSERLYSSWTSWGTLSIDNSGNEPSRFYEVSYSSRCVGGSGVYLPAVEIRKWTRSISTERYEWVWYALVPAEGTYTYTGSGGNRCQVTITLRNVGGVCPSDVTQAPSEVDEVDLSQRRQVPVKVFPRVEDFVRPDVVSADPSLRWLRDEYQRIASDSSIPTIPSDALGDLELPSVDWSISPDEALREGEGAREGDIDISVPGLDTSLNVPERKAFPVQLINQLVESHPLLRILRGVSLDATGGGSCVFGSQPFVINMCDWRWVLNLMGSFLVPLAFLYGLGIGGRSE